MENPWYKEITRSLAIISAFGIVGYIAGDYTLYGIIFGLLICLFMLYQQIYLLGQWLGKEPLDDPQNDTTLIGNLYYQNIYIQKKHRDRVNYLGRIIRRFEESARALPDAVIILNERNEVEWLNVAAKRLVGLKRKKDIGQTISNLIRYPEFIHYLMREDFQYPIEFPSPVDENIRIRARIVPFGRKSRLLVIRDVTQLHNLEQMRQDFIANTSHELRTPLTVITGYLEALQDSENLEDMNDITDAMLNQSRRMESIISDMLLLARMESLQHHREHTRIPVNISLQINAIIEDAEASSSHSHHFKVNMADRLNLLGHEAELHSAFSNLIQNAIYHTPDNTTISVTWKKGINGVAQFIVEDNGPGIEAIHLERLTERFYRADVGRSRDSGGTGLGLAIVQQIIKHHDGQLLIESKIGKGSRFICEFPSHLVLDKDARQIKAVP